MRIIIVTLSLIGANQMCKKTGGAGEMAVAAQLILCGLTATPLQNGAEKCDILVSDPKTSKAKTVEVKSTSEKIWTIENIPENKNLVYVLVYFPYKPGEHFTTKKNNKLKRPDFYILTIEEVKQLWKPGIGIYGKGGIKKSQLKNNKCREEWGKILDNGDEYGYNPKRSKKQKEYAEVLSYSLKKAQKKGRKMNGKFRKGWDNSRITKYAHKLAKKNN